jgi:hypothetical protein
MGVCAKGTLQEWWYIDLNVDPTEKVPGYWPADSESIRRRILAEVNLEIRSQSSGVEALPGQRPKSPKSAPVLEDDQRGALEALGYIE